MGENSGNYLQRRELRIYLLKSVQLSASRTLFEGLFIKV